MRKLFFNKTGCQCILKLQAKEELENNRCLKCRATSNEFEAEKQRVKADGDRE